MNIYEKIVDIGEAFGFKVGKLNVKTIEVRQEIRMMCEKNICGMYALNWSCPPGCGSLKECQKKSLSIHRESWYKQLEIQKTSLM